jgi:ABC-2 type transport system permease protein
MKTKHPAIELLRFRLLIFLREPEAIFWTYGFPLILTVLLGLAFRVRPPEQVEVAVVEGPQAQFVMNALQAEERNDRFHVGKFSLEECQERLRLGKCVLVVEPGRTPSGSEELREDPAAESSGDPSEAPPTGPEGATIIEDQDSDTPIEVPDFQHPFAYRFDPTQPKSAAARLEVDQALQQAAGRTDPIPTQDREVTEPGSRYIDFLIPGLVGMNIMGGGLWGVGFAIVDMRVRKLLKRLIATPMRRSQFMMSLVGGRMTFLIPELAVILLAGNLLFGVPIRGHLLSVLLVGVAGAWCFAGLGLLVASRAQRIETVTGLMNMVMMPMWLMSGIFFSTENFPGFLQPVIQLLPLTQLINAERAIILEGASLGSQVLPLLFLLLVGSLCFGLALRWFRWT